MEPGTYVLKKKRERFRCSNKCNMGTMCIPAWNYLMAEKYFKLSLELILFTVSYDQWRVIMSHKEKHRGLSVVVMTMRKGKDTCHRYTSLHSTCTEPSLAMQRGRRQWKHSHKASTSSPLGHQRPSGNGWHDHHYPFWIQFWRATPSRVFIRKS